ncbi:acyl-CoA dehydrogenase family protein [Oceanibacterium hippocampi]|uniref:Acryloyl-CoA reductase (NADH) n=1 Tax=Oceanibacterium hippocampi TaxID=745714 RepID=A0A1Y5S487_9PROT|nr:acyl-CoA dehydrogenase family protein [Oceanibacterium hippocampi]SLN32321.1 Acryloyl-CoA reductase (NADH) [Oceanibacterium hippocampi]
MALDQETFGQLCDTVRRFVRERLVPLEERVEEEDDVPPEVIREMADLGLFGISVPESYGGLGLSLSEEIEVIRELCQTSLAFRSAIGTNVGIGSQGLVMDGTEEQRARYLPKIASGEMVISFALTEPEAGSDAASLRTSARRDGHEYVLNGSKRYITNATRAGAFTVMARTDPDSKGAGGISAFIVEAGTPSLSVGKPDRKMGQRGTKTADVIFEDCRVPAENLIGGREGQGFYMAMRVLDRGRLHLSSVAIGQAERMLRDTVRYASERRQFGQAIADFQLIQGLLADCRTELFAASAMVRETARRFDGQQSITLDAACCKYFATEMVGRVADRCVQIHGGAGYMAEYAIERFYRDVRLLRLYEGTSQVQQLVIARNLMKSMD